MLQKVPIAFKAHDENKENRRQCGHKENVQSMFRVNSEDLVPYLASCLSFFIWKPVNLFGMEIN